MSCIQITAFQPCCTYASANQLHSDSSTQSVSPLQCLQLRKASINLTARSSSYLGLKIHAKPWKLTPIASGCKKPTPFCLFGGKGKSESDAEGSPWKALEKAMGNLKQEPSIEEMLRQQIQKQEYYDNGGSGGKNTGGGGGGGGDDDISSPGDSDGESLSGIFEETGQVILATIGFIFLYMLIIDGQEITTFARDILKFLFTRRKSIRLTRFIDNWTRFFREITATEDSDPYWLEREIINTPTWFDSPTKYERILRRHMSSRSY